MEKEGAHLLVGVVGVDPAVTLGSLLLSRPWVTLGSTVSQLWVKLDHPWENGGRFHYMYFAIYIHIYMYAYIYVYIEQCI